MIGAEPIKLSDMPDLSLTHEEFCCCDLCCYTEAELQAITAEENFNHLYLDDTDDLPF